RQRVSPPFRILRQLFLRVFALGGVLRIRQFQVGPVHYHAGPVRQVPYLVHLQTYLGILSHPLDLLADGGKEIQVSRLVGETNGYYVGLVVQRTRQSADRYTV